jgi:hypothetical protein
MSGCIPIPIHRKAITGDGGIGKMSDLNVLKGKAVTRDVVQEKLGFLDTGSSTPGFFWGRWERAWDLHAIWVLPPVAFTTKDTSWHSGNLIVEFSEDGQATNWDVVDDGHILQSLIHVVKRTRPTPIREPQLPASCRFEWNQLTRVKVKSLRKKAGTLFTIFLEFRTGSQKVSATACEVGISPKLALMTVAYLVSSGRESVVK